MNQQDQSNLPLESISTIRTDIQNDNKKESAKNTRHEWLPEDDDEWYEPDYCRSDRLS